VSASFDIQSSTGAYRVTIENGLFQNVISAAASQKSGRIFIADEYFAPVFEKTGIEAITLSSAETTKSLDAMPAVITEMRRRGANRQTELLAIGGGIVQDVAAFVASVFMRGIAWKYVPTTVLAMADSCIGGKSSINVGPYKNLVGTFHPPLEILIDPLLTDTLTPEQRSAGLIEAAKICYCRGEHEFGQYLSFNAGPHMPGNSLEPLLTASLMSKKWFIETDEFDQAERLLLNFGHTFGHAIEGAAHFRISHGIAVAVGILCALEYRKASGAPQNARVAALEAHMRHLAGASPELKMELDQLSIADIVERFQADKKHTATHYTLILPGPDSRIALTRHEKSPQVREQIGAAIAAAVGSLA
jgi:3-dehydroquinate synthase